MIVVSLPAVTMGETIHLRDGSSIKGTLTRIAGDTLYFKTSFGVVVPVARDKVARIDFVEGLPAPGQTSGAGATAAAPGSLVVVFDEFQMTSRISMHRERDRDGHVRENSIEQLLLANEVPVASYVDSVTDKEIREGPDTTLRNDMKPREIRVGLAPGYYECRLLIGNHFVDRYADRFVSSPLEKVLVIPSVDVRSGQTKVLRVGLKRKALGLGGSRLIQLH